VVYANLGVHIVVDEQVLACRALVMTFPEFHKLVSDGLEDSPTPVSFGLVPGHTCCGRECEAPARSRSRISCELLLILPGRRLRDLLAFGWVDPTLNDKVRRLVTQCMRDSNGKVDPSRGFQTQQVLPDDPPLGPSTP